MRHFCRDLSQLAIWFCPNHRSKAYELLTTAGIPEVDAPVPWARKNKGQHPVELSCEPIRGDGWMDGWYPLFFWGEDIQSLTRMHQKWCTKLRSLGQSHQASWASCICASKSFCKDVGGGQSPIKMQSCSPKDFRCFGFLWIFHDPCVFLLKWLTSSTGNRSLTILDCCASLNDEIFGIACLPKLSKHKP